MSQGVDVGYHLGPQLWLWLEYLHVAFPYGHSDFASMKRVSRQKESYLKATQFHFSLFCLLEESHYDQPISRKGNINYTFWVKVKVAQLCLTLCDTMDYAVYGTLQAGILEWVAIPVSRDLSDPGIEPGSPTLQADSLPSEPPGKPEWVSLKRRVTFTSWRLCTKTMSSCEFNLRYRRHEPWGNMAPQEEILLQRITVENVSLISPQLLAFWTCLISTTPPSSCWWNYTLCTYRLALRLIDEPAAHRIY